MSAVAGVPGWWARHAQFYRAAAAHDFQLAVQYRWPTLLGLVALMTEPVVYLVVWRTVAEANGGTIGGLTAGQVSAYYIVWTLTRNLTAGYSPENWQQRFQEGTLADLLLRPVHPVHADIAGGFGFNLPRALAAIPLGVALIVVFEPDFSAGLAEALVFPVTLVAAYLLRSLLFCAVGAIGFWTTRVDAASRIYMALELLMSGRLVPVVLFPTVLATTAEWLPFRYTFGFPIEVLTTPMSSGELVVGLARQTAWVVVVAALVAWVWRRALGRFDSVGI